MKLLDLFCGVGGAAEGYRRAGFEVVGVDIKPQPRYPFAFVQADALEYLAAHGHEFDAIHASPPCQRFTKAQTIRQREHPDYLAPTRQALEAIGRPWVIENVPGAPLCNPIELCGAMFGLRTYRHRHFETSFPVAAPDHPAHVAPQTKMGRRVRDGEYMHIVGNFIGADLGRRVMQIPWASRRELAQAIPPAYTEFIGRELISWGADGESSLLDVAKGG